VLLTSDQPDKIKLNAVWVLSNLIAEPDFNIRNQVVERSKLIEYFYSIVKIGQRVPEQLITTIPWVMFNLFKGGPAYTMKQEYVVTTCLRLLAANL